MFFPPIIMTLMKWWMVLLFLLAIALLFIEASSSASTGESLGNLNNLNAMIRNVNGIKQACLKLLPSKEIYRLDFPTDTEPNSAVKRVVYKSDTDRTYIGGNNTLFQQFAKATRFNVFTGIQTFHEREESYQANETAVMHCGFYSENGGFKMSGDDRSYMQTCKAVVSIG